MKARRKRQAWLSRVLLRPPAQVVGRAERRRARLLATLQLTQCAQLIPCALVMTQTESGSAGVAIGGIMVGSGTAIACTYALNRLGHVRAALWLYLFVNVLITPATCLVAEPSPDFSPFIAMAYLLPSILIANTLASARVTLAVAALGLCLSALPMWTFGTAAWHRDILHGLMFALVNLGLVVAFGVHRDRVERDRSRELRSRNEELEGLRRTLEEKIEQRTAQLSARNREMRLVLDHVTEGVFTLDKNGHFVSEPSAALSTWFGHPWPDEPFYRYFERHAPHFGVQAQLAWSQVVDGLLPLDVTLAQVPSRFVAGDRQYSLSIAPIGEADRQRFLVVVADITSAVEREAMLRERRETFALFEHMVGDRAGFVAFMEDASSMVARILARRGNPIDFARDVHTLKGNTLSFGIESVGQICHALESRMQETNALPSEAELAELAERWSRISADVARLLGDRKRFIHVSPEQHAELERALERGDSAEHVLQMVRLLKLEPAGPRLQHLAAQTRQLAERLGKSVSVEVSDDGTRVDGRRWAPLWAALVHATRNAVDHGLEGSAERTQAHKPARGRIWLRVRSTGSNVHVEVEDDGRGVDREALRQRLAAGGQRAAMDGGLLALLCADGVSTAATVSDLSGRGVGMGALQAAVHALGGTLLVQTEKGAGTLLRAAIPNRSVLGTAAPESARLAYVS